MRSLFSILIVIAALIIFCAPQDEPDQQDGCNDNVCNLPAQIVNNRIPFSKENWSFSVPDSDWDYVEIGDLDIKVATKNEDKNCLAIFNSGPTIDNITSFVVKTVELFSTNENIIQSMRQVVIHNNLFVEIEVHGTDEIVWYWLTVKNKIEYELSCGGDIVFDAGTATYDLCQDIANTVEIK